MESLADGIADTTGYWSERASGQVFGRRKVLKRRANTMRHDGARCERDAYCDEREDHAIGEKAKKVRHHERHRAGKHRHRHRRGTQQGRWETHSFSAA